MYSIGAHYSALPPDPLPPGPRVTNPAAPVLRLLLRVFNVALAALSLLLAGDAAWLWQRYRHGGGAPPAPPPELEDGMAVAAAEVAGFPW
jgi:hypothetical protein